MTRPRLAAVLETALYAADLPRARRFYEEVLGLAPMFADERLAAYAVGASVLLLFQQGTTEQPVRLPGGCIPPMAPRAVSTWPWRSRRMNWKPGSRTWWQPG